MHRIAWIGTVAALALAPTPALANCTVGQMLELKATMEGRSPMVQVGINGHNERFVADSGAFYSTISAGKAAELGLHLQQMSPNFHLKGIGGEVTPYLTTVRTLDLAGLQLHNINFIVGGSEIGNGAGLLGQNVLGIADVEYDLAHGMVRLMKMQGCKGMIPAYWAGSKPISTVVIEPRDERQRHTIGTITINGVKMRATFDTGANSTVMAMSAAKKLGITPESPGVRPDGYGHGIGSKTVASYLIPIDSIKLGDQEEIRRTHIRAETIDLDTDLLIGADFFLSHRVYVANGMYRLFFTYEGGPIFNEAPSQHIDQSGAKVVDAPDTTEPTDAAGYSRRGAAFMARRDYTHAIADLDKAVAMAPTESRYLLERAEAHGRNRQPLLAMDDLDQALKVDPANGEARLARASFRLARHDRAAAEEDVSTVEKTAAPAADVRLTLAGMYDALDQPERALPNFDLWLKYHPEDSRKPNALNGRCWARAQIGTDLNKALSDCDSAIRARPNAAAYLNSRALVRLRMGDNAKALEDYQAALALQPKMAWSLYGRGVAEQRLGQAEQGKKDKDAAAAMDAAVTTRAKRLGLST